MSLDSLEVKGNWEVEKLNQFVMKAFKRFLDTPTLNSNKSISSVFPSTSVASAAKYLPQLPAFLQSLFLKFRRFFILPRIVLSWFSSLFVVLITNSFAFIRQKSSQEWCERAMWWDIKWQMWLIYHNTKERENRKIGYENVRWKLKNFWEGASGDFLYCFVIFI